MTPKCTPHMLTCHSWSTKGYTVLDTFYLLVNVLELTSHTK